MTGARAHYTVMSLRTCTPDAVIANSTMFCSSDMLHLPRDQPRLRDSGIEGDEVIGYRG